MFSVTKKHKNGKISYYWKGIKIFYKHDHYSEFQKIKRKLAMIDNIWRNNDTLFYVPNYPIDLVQSWIVDRQQYYEQDILIELKKEIPENAVILDIGANIGNHSLFWAKEHHAKRIISFEPIKSTYDILTKNVELNKLQNIIEPHNTGLSNRNGCAKIQSYDMHNIGATVIEKTENSELSLARLDSINLTHLEKIDFIKIDVEKHELFVLEGAKETIAKYKPVIFIEIFNENKEKVFNLLHQYQYTPEKEFGDNYLFRPCK